MKNLQMIDWSATSRQRSLRLMAQSKRKQDVKLFALAVVCVALFLVTLRFAFRVF